MAHFRVERFPGVYILLPQRLQFLHCMRWVSVDSSEPDSGLTQAGIRTFNLAISPLNTSLNCPNALRS